MEEGNSDIDKYWSSFSFLRDLRDILKLLTKWEQSYVIYLPLKRILSTFFLRIVTWDKRERSWSYCPPLLTNIKQGAGRGRKKNISKVSFHWDEEGTREETALLLSLLAPVPECWNPRANEDRWVHPYCWGLDTNENYFMVKSCHRVHWLISRVRSRVTLPACQLLIIEPQSVGERIQKDEATVGSQLTFTAHNKGKNSSRALFCISHLLLGRDVSRMSCYRARRPQGGRAPWGWRWHLFADQRPWLQIGDGEGQTLGALFLKGSAVLSTAFPFLQGDLQPFQTCSRDLSTASLRNDILLSTFWGYKLSPRITSLTPLRSWFLLASVSYLYK